MDNIFVQFNGHDVRVWHLKHGLEKELFLRMKRSTTSVSQEITFKNKQTTMTNPHTMMDLSPRAPVFLSRAILAMALRAS